MSQVDLEASVQQATHEARERAAKAPASNAAFVVQLKTASDMTNAKLRENAARAGIHAPAHTVVGTAVKAAAARSPATTTPAQIAAQQQVAGQALIQKQTSTKATQTSPNAVSVVGNTSAAVTTGSTSTDAALSVNGSQNSSAQLLQATSRLQELNQQFNLQYLQLQESEQAQNRQFTSISNVSKLRSDTAKNSISNLK